MTDPEKPRERRLVVKMTGPQLATVSRAATSSGQDRSNWVRRILLEAAAKQLAKAPIPL